MAVFRVEKNNNYTVMSNIHLKDKRLSLKAKGLLSVMLSLPDDWDYSINGLIYITGEKETPIKNALRELKDNGYLVVEKQMPTLENGGRISYTYCVYEEPQDIENQQQKQQCKKQGVEKQGVEFQGVEIQGIEKVPLNKVLNKINTNIINTNDSNNVQEKNKKFKKPTIEEIREYCKERNNNVDCERFYNYYEANGWKVGKNPMKNWKACVRIWESNNLKDKPNKVIETSYDLKEFNEKSLNEPLIYKKKGRNEHGT